MTEGGRIKHYMIDQTPDGQYQVVGNRKLFCAGRAMRGWVDRGLTDPLGRRTASLNALVEHHHSHNIVSNDPVTLLYPCGQAAGHDDTKELRQ